MNVYALAVLKMYGKLPTKVSLYYIKNNGMVDYVPENENIDVQRERIEEMIGAVPEEKFEAVPSYGCRFCGYAGIREAKEHKI